MNTRFNVKKSIQPFFEYLDNLDIEQIQELDFNVASLTEGRRKDGSLPSSVSNRLFDREFRIEPGNRDDIEFPAGVDKDLIQTSNNELIEFIRADIKNSGPFSQLINDVKNEKISKMLIYKSMLDLEFSESKKLNEIIIHYINDNLLGEHLDSAWNLFVKKNKIKEDKYLKELIQREIVFQISQPILNYLLKDLMELSPKVNSAVTQKNAANPSAPVTKKSMAPRSKSTANILSGFSKKKIETKAIITPENIDVKPLENKPDVIKKKDKKNFLQKRMSQKEIKPKEIKRNDIMSDPNQLAEQSKNKKEINPVQINEPSKYFKKR